MNRIISFKLLLIIFVVCLGIFHVEAKKFSDSGVTITYDELDDGTIQVIDAINGSDRRVDVSLDGKAHGIKAHASIKINQRATKFVRVDFGGSGSGPKLWTYKAPKTKKEDKPVQETASPSPSPSPATVGNEGSATPVQPSGQNVKPAKEPESVRDLDIAGTKEESVVEIINQDEFFGRNAVAEYVARCNELYDGLMSADDKSGYIVNNDVNGFLARSSEELSRQKEELRETATNMLASFSVKRIRKPDVSVDLVIESLNSRLTSREAAFNKLKKAVENVPLEEVNTESEESDIANYVIFGLIGLIVIGGVIFFIVKGKKTSKQGPVKGAEKSVENDSNPVIVVRRRTASVLKKQSLDDVINNPAYLRIDSRDFADDCAVRNIYLKNSCIKEIYDLYEEDLRNTDNPKEDGCMVIGRWVLNPEDQTYDVSLESIVLPGDDAVFKEYELNFGGKIKLSVTDKLRKLRKETNLQYDLVCWIHSHPGLGVFFSNSDNNVHLQLKHAQHPNFLIAFVVDILTSDQEMGIFTFRHDGTINSKGDLKKMYSLESLYKWAIDSEKHSYNSANYYNVIENSLEKLPVCRGIELNNSSIIDLTKLISNSSEGIAGWVIGASIDSRAGKEYVISSIISAEGRPHAGVVGVVMNMPHISLPTVQRLLSGRGLDVSFVLVYSSKLETLTSIPVKNGVLMTDDKYYGEVRLEDLKIWTRRKR